MHQRVGFVDARQSTGTRVVARRRAVEGETIEYRKDSALFMVSALILSNVPKFDSKSTKVINGVTALVSLVGEGLIDPDEEDRLRSAEVGVSVRSNRRETRAPTMGPRHRGNKPYDCGQVCVLRACQTRLGTTRS